MPKAPTLSKNFVLGEPDAKLANAVNYNQKHVQFPIL